MRHRVRIDEIPAGGSAHRLDEGTSLFRAVLVEVLESSADHRCQVDVELGQRSRRVHVDGLLSGTLVLSCARCAGAFPFEVERSVHAVLVLDQPSVDEGEEEELERSELDESFLDGEHIDLLELAREQVLLSLPEKPLCRDECRGLCPRCGVDLNHESCSCESNTVDPRMAVLAKLMIEDEDEPS